MQKRWIRWVIAVPIALIVLVVGGTWVYLNVIREPAPARLTLDSADAAPTSTTSTAPTASTSVAAATVDGTWKVTSGSQAGYRVPEVLNGLSTEAVGRTTDVTGSLTIAGTEVRAATFTVDLTTVASDESRRDGQFRDRIMDVADHPDATFALTAPIALGAVPEVGGRVSVEATGNLTLRGVTKPVTFTLEAERTATGFKTAGSIPLVFSDFGIPNPSAGPAQVGDEGELEFLLVFARA